MENIPNWKQILRPYEQAVEELIIKFNFIAEDCKNNMQYSPIEAVTGRVKNVSSIMEKAASKNIPIDEIENRLDDIAGIRLICRFVEDIPKVVDLIHQREGHDIEIIEERDYVSNPKGSGYRSYHIHIRYTVNTFYGPKKLNCEIQIRTLAMNFWAVNEHSLKYKYGRNIPPELQERLKICAEAAFKLDREMSTIRDEILFAQRLNEKRESLMTSILDNIEELGHLGSTHFVAEDIDSEFLKIWDTKDIEQLRKFNDKLLGFLESATEEVL